MAIKGLFVRTDPQRRRYGVALLVGVLSGIISAFVKWGAEVPLPDVYKRQLKESVEMASRAQVTLAMEIMDYPLMNSISKALGYAHYLNNPWFQLYPDIGNLSAWDNDVQMELQAGIGHIVAVHVKDTKPGVFKNVPFGEGVVDFERCFETLKQSGYCGPYLIEMWSETAEDPAAEVVKARDWVKARMAKAGMVEAA